MNKNNTGFSTFIPKKHVSSNWKNTKSSTANSVIMICIQITSVIGGILIFANISVSIYDHQRRKSLFAVDAANQLQLN